MSAKSWTVQISLDEQDGTTEADAVLDAGAKVEVRGHGTARRHPKDEEDHQIGDELAAARDIESHTHTPAAPRL